LRRIGEKQSMQRPDLGSTARYIAWYARQTPDATAIIEGSFQANYRRMAADLERCVGALEALRIAAGMLVGVETPVRYQHLVLLLACETIGAVTLSLTPTELSAETTLFQHCDILLVCGEWPDADLRGGWPKRAAIVPGWFASPATQVVDDSEESLLRRLLSPDRVVRIVKTSGTTGGQKAMPMSSSTQQLRIVRAMGRVAPGILPNPRFLCLYNLAVSTIYVRVLGILQHGGTVLFSIEQHACALIAAGAVNYAKVAVGDAEQMVRIAEAPPPGHILTLEVFGAAISAGLRQAIRDRLHAVVASAYSSNETNPIAVMDDDNVGTICPGVDVRIVDECGRDRPHGSVGHIRVRSETMVHGYFRNPSLTARAFIDGWFCTGDIGTIPEPGKLIVAGRIDDMLNIGGVKVARLPLEGQLRLIDGVSDVVALSVPSRNRVGMLIVAVETGMETLSNDLLAKIGTVLSRYVRRFEIVPLRWFPRSDSGKVRRGEIESFVRERIDGRSTVA
jgi:acyl-CoA synthetase (AMP-forming)/AMP-acid ligase II